MEEKKDTINIIYSELKEIVTASCLKLNPGR